MICHRGGNGHGSSGAIQTTIEDNELILEAFRSLFSALVTWEANGSLTLDISLYSPSDREHAFKYLTFVPDALDPATQRELEPMSVAGNDEDSDDKHQWRATDAGPLIPPDSSLDRLFSYAWLPRAEEGECWEQAPKVAAVTRLVMRA